MNDINLVLVLPVTLLILLLVGIIYSLYYFFLGLAGGELDD